MSILIRRIFAALIDALIVAILELAVLCVFGPEALQSLFAKKVTFTAFAGSTPLTVGPPAMFSAWFVIGFLDGLLVFIQPLTLLSLGKVNHVFPSPEGQIWLIGAFSLLLNAVYRIVAEFLPAHASIGMRLYKLKVDYQRFTIRQNPVVRHFAKILTMPVVVIASLIGVPLAHVFARSDDSDIGYYTRKLAGLDAAEMLHDEVADVFVVALDAPEGA